MGTDPVHRSGFDAEAADARTLVLSAPALSAEKLEAFVCYQRAFVEMASRDLTLAHQAAVTLSGLAAAEVGALAAICADYCGKRWTVRSLRQKLSSIRAKGAKAEPSEEQLAERLAKELRRLDTLERLERRYGAQALRLLGEREEELVSLHVAQQEVLGRPSP